MRLYVAGPMTGRPDLNFPAFRSAAELLRQLGHDAVSPAEINPNHSMPWAECMKRDIPALCTCDGIVMLDGWEFSRGATLERYVAEHLGLKVHSIDEFEEAFQ
jgi:Domain of unknown function (DUF4406)